MKQKELLKLLTEAGCLVVRHGSRHDIWYSPVTGKTRPVPRHGSKEVPTGLLLSLKKDLLGL